MLQGFTVGITADRRWDEQAGLFERRGAAIQHGPSIHTVPLGTDGRLREATDALIRLPPDVLIANTGLGISSWLGAAEGWGLGAQLRRSLSWARVYARGPKASGAVHAAGLEVTDRPDSELLRDAIDLALLSGSAGRRVAIQVDGSGSIPDVDRLRESGADVVVVPVYVWQLPDDHRPALRLAEAVSAGRIHAVTFTAAPAVRNWFSIAREEGIDESLRSAVNDGDVVVGCVGPVCAEAAASEGIRSERVVVPPAFRLGPLVRAVADRLAARVVRAGAGDGAIVVTGTVATVDGEQYCLTPTEARLLTALAGRPNVVLSKEELLETVWDGEAHDPHLVEVVVARLRRRLGEHGQAITAVHRRGYALRI